VTFDLGEQNLTLAESGRKHAAQAGLDEAEATKGLEFDASTDGFAEASVSATVKGGTLTAYGRYAWEGMKGWAAGLRYRKTLK